MYINGITNTSLVKEARRRLCEIDTEYIFSSADIEMLIEDSTLFPLPQLLKTERPDRAAAQLSDGKVIIIVQGSPFVLILPATARDLSEASEDNYVRIAEANFMRFIRLVGCFLALFLPGIFISTVLYHHESIPTDLLFAIEASREQMPFPIAFELVIMILAFELIKEASIRVPEPIGSTLGIVGGLILGQSAVSANIASPLLIIIVSIAALGAFAAPSTSISRAISVLQFVFIFLGSIAGFLGLAFGTFGLCSYLASEKSFGVPYMSGSGNADSPFAVAPIWRREKRPKNLFTQNPEKQPHISRKWKGED
jgi:spore germination protein KA